MHQILIPVIQWTCTLDFMIIFVCNISVIECCHNHISNLQSQTTKTAIVKRIPSLIFADSTVIIYHENVWRFWFCVQSCGLQLEFSTADKMRQIVYIVTSCLLAHSFQILCRFPKKHRWYSGSQLCSAAVGYSEAALQPAACTLLFLLPLINQSWSKCQCVWRTMTCVCTTLAHCISSLNLMLSLCLQHYCAASM